MLLAIRCYDRVLSIRDWVVINYCFVISSYLPTCVGWCYLWEVASLCGLEFNKGNLPILHHLVADCESKESDKEALRKAGPLTHEHIVVIVSLVSSASVVSIASIASTVSNATNSMNVSKASNA